MIKLYYSPKCKYCIELLQIIKKNEIKVEIVDIGKSQYPDYVKSVPTLASSDFVKPLVGKSVFEWVNNQQFFNKGSNNIYSSKGIIMPKSSELLIANVEPHEKVFCSITDSTNLLI